MLQYWTNFSSHLIGQKTNNHQMPVAKVSESPWKFYLFSMLWLLHKSLLASSVNFIFLNLLRARLRQGTRKSRTRSALRWFPIYLQFPFGNSEQSTFNNTSAHRITNSPFLFETLTKAAWRFADARRRRRKISNRVDEIWANLFDARLELSRKLRSFVWCVTAKSDHKIQFKAQATST